ncbi:methylated-DNA-protein-cysteine methyltransferase-like protein [Ancylomarina subtilis]|uniref:Methylated-DNA-protein-cysteine methyltransferase-like protein n=1 Tax=Ancylomarina subtilis TaxID=1639035 RepID=A0A4V2FRZ0_9BACT|nr:MGMT family protein [Ancylomarina subtilis]RZT92319.1 methylated-DNA-protein-cysteine methyltransferase-like protein [Ancylomarina subtilis]
MSDIYTRIFKVVQQIPPGRVCNYGTIARYVGSPRGSRLVGWAMNNSHSRDAYIPAHRVVNRIGMLSGKHHFPGENVMQQLLENEGIVVIDDQIQNFEKHFWDPIKELPEDFCSE